MFIKGFKENIFTIFTLILLCISIKSDDDQACKDWTNVCLQAKSNQIDNYQCIETSIFYYENSRLNWDESRQVCAQKFDAIYGTDLFQLTKDTKNAATLMMKGLKDKGIIDSTKTGQPITLATSGACCLRKLKDNQFKTDTCQWLTTGLTIDDAKPKEGQQCAIYTVKYNPTSNKFEPTDFFEKASDQALDNFLCAYNAPPKCAHPTPSPTPTPTVTTTTPSGTTDPSPAHTTTLSPEEVNEGLDDLEEKLKKNLTTSELLDCSEKLADILTGGSLVTNTSLDKTLNIIDNLQQKVHNQTKDSQILRRFTEHMVESCSKILDSDRAWDQLKQKDIKSKFSSNILQIMQKSSFALGCRESTNNSTIGHKPIEKDNIVIQTFTMDYSRETKFEVNHMDSSITIPAGMPEPPVVDSCIRGTAVGAVFNKLSRYLSEQLAVHNELNSDIVAFSVQNNPNSTALPAGIPPVQVVLKHTDKLKFGDKVQCVFWDFKQMKWSSQGCHFQQMGSDRKVSVCECNHLTNFAALMDVSGRETNEDIKDILTKVCCGLSILCLIITICFLTLVKKLRNRRNNITCNLCLCLLIVNVLVVFGMDQTKYNALCQTISALLLYFLLASFAWMLMEGYLLYQMIILVFSNKGYLRLIYLYVIGYGAPLVITMATLLGIGFNDIKENDSYFCWISSPSHPYRVWAVAGPAVVVILANTLIMYLALREAFSAKTKKKIIQEKDISNTTSTSHINKIVDKLAKSLSWIKGFVSLLVVLGITWLSFVMYIHEFGHWFSYIFIVFNGLQGVFIFIFQILLNEKARSWVRKSIISRQASQILTTLFRTGSSNVLTTTSRSKSVSKTASYDPTSNDLASNTGGANRSANAAVAKRLSHTNSNTSVANQPGHKKLVQKTSSNNIRYA